MADRNVRPPLVELISWPVPCFSDLKEKGCLILVRQPFSLCLSMRAGNAGAFYFLVCLHSILTEVCGTASRRFLGIGLPDLTQMP